MNYENYLEQKTNTQMYEQRILDLASNYLSEVEHIYIGGTISTVQSDGVFVEFTYKGDYDYSVFVPKDVITHAFSEVQWVADALRARERERAELQAKVEALKAEQEYKEKQAQIERERQKMLKKRKRDLELLASLKKEYPDV